MGFLSDLTGGTARKELKKSKKAADAALLEGYTGATKRYGEAYDEFTPFASGGIEANNRYNALLGLRGDEERAAAGQTYTSDPIFSSLLNQQSNALLRQQNARGQTYGGQTIQMGGRLALENFNGYLDRLRDQGGQGLQVAGARSGVKQSLGDLDFGYGATRAGQNISYGNARAEASKIGVNNLLNIAGTAAKAYAASDVRLKRDIVRVGAMPSGLPIYEFSYVWGPERHRGVMAQEALMYKPEAVAVDEYGYLAVDYAQIG